LGLLRDSVISFSNPGGKSVGSGKDNLVFCYGEVCVREKNTLNTKEILEHINEEISRLQQVRELLQGSSNGHARASVNGAAAPKVKGKRVLSAEARKKIAAAQRRRWAKAKRASA
jgi:hypothetical protein